MMSSDSTDSVVAVSFSFCVAASVEACDDFKSSATRSLVCNGSGLLSRVALTLALLFGPVMRRAAGTMAVLACDNVGEGKEGRTGTAGAAGINAGFEISGLPWSGFLVICLSVDPV
jgi:hypothetical protein